MAMSSDVQCPEHGVQPQTFVCQHLVASLGAGQPIGFWWSKDDDSERPDAWCTACKEQLASTGQEWTPESEAFARPKLICGGCYDRAYEINVGKRQA